MNFDEDYFKEEVRHDFKISSMMKRAWAAEMEVLCVIDQICKKHNISYFADGGTLIGAVRHKGFIPWDDDIDIALKREDYLKFVNICETELPEGFVLAGMYSKEKRLQNACFASHVRVIADETKWKFGEYMKYFHGFPYQRIGIDIFPLDYIPSDKEILNVQKEILRYGILTLQNWDMFKTQGVLEERVNELEDLCNQPIIRDEDIKNNIWILLDKVSSLFSKDDGTDIVNYIFFLENDGFRCSAKCYDRMILTPFEDIEIPIPNGYHEVLTRQFGDYNKFVKGTAEHVYPFYGHMEDELRKQIRAVGFNGSEEEFCKAVLNGEFKI